ncbi:MAG: type II secretion system protein GspM, partial [Noviherbaspirillum sp.]
NMLSAALAVVVLGLIYALLIDPALAGRTDLEKKLPAMRQQAAEVQALAKEASGLGATGTGTSAPPPISKESIESSLSRKGLKAQSVSLSGDLAKVQLSGVPFTATVDWLNEMQKTARLSVTDATVEAQTQADTVNATVSLRQQRGE